MAIPKEVLDALMKEYKGPDDILGTEGLVKQLSKALIERAMQTELTEQLGYEKNDTGEKNREPPERLVNKNLTNRSVVNGN